MLQHNKVEILDKRRAVRCCNKQTKDRKFIQEYIGTCNFKIEATHLEYNQLQSVAVGHFLKKKIFFSIFDVDYEYMKINAI